MRIENGSVINSTRSFFLSPFSEGWAGRLDVKKENDTTNGDGKERPEDNGMKGVYHLEICMFHC